jgi:hypothetical protein
MSLAARLTVRSKVLLGLAAPIDAAGELVLGCAVLLVIHFLGAEMTTRDL